MYLECIFACIIFGLYYCLTELHGLPNIRLKNISMHQLYTQHSPQPADTGVKRGLYVPSAAHGIVYCLHVNRLHLYIIEGKDTISKPAKCVMSSSQDILFICKSYFRLLVCHYYCIYSII